MLIALFIRLFFSPHSHIVSQRTIALVRTAGKYQHIIYCRMYTNEEKQDNNNKTPGFYITSRLWNKLTNM